MRAGDALKVGAEQVTHGTAVRPEEGDAGAAGLAGAVTFRPACSYRTRTMLSVWSPGTSKVKKSEKRQRIDLRNLRKTAQDLHNEVPPKAIP